MYFFYYSTIIFNHISYIYICVCSNINAGEMNLCNMDDIFSSVLCVYNISHFIASIYLKAHSLSLSECCCTADTVELSHWRPCFSATSFPGEAHSQQQTGSSTFIFELNKTVQWNPFIWNVIFCGFNLLKSEFFWILLRKLWVGYRYITTLQVNTVYT